MNARISEGGQVTILQELLERRGLNPDDEADITVTNLGLLVRKMELKENPVERVYGKWGVGGSTDDYMNLVQGS